MLNILYLGWLLKHEKYSTRTIFTADSEVRQIINSILIQNGYLSIGNDQLVLHSERCLKHEKMVNSYYVQSAVSQAWNMTSLQKYRGSLHTRPWCLMRPVRPIRPEMIALILGAWVTDALLVIVIKLMS